MNENAALTAVLVAEHQAVYAYGVLGARLDDVSRAAALRAYDAHRVARDAVLARLRAAGQTPPGPSSVYDLTIPGRAAALQLAIRVESELAVRWRDLIASTTTLAVRQLAVPALQDCAIRATQWRVTAKTSPATVALPGTA